MNMGKRTKKLVEHKSGYYAWVANRKYWHRTYEGAVKRVEDPSNWHCRDSSQIIEVKSGKLVWGMRR